jgi:hypothetical protein
VTLYAPAFSATWVPGASAPGNEPGVALGPVTFIVKSAATAVPPSSLITCLITISLGWTSSLVTVQVFVCPIAIVPAQSEDRLAA